MNAYEVRQVIVATDDLEASIAFYTGVLGFTVKVRDGDHYAALDGGSITVALATESDHPLPGEVALAIRADDIDDAAASVAAAGGVIVTPPHDGAHERRAVVRDDRGNGLVFYQPLHR